MPRNLDSSPGAALLDQLCRWIDIPSISGAEEDYARAAAAALAEQGFSIDLDPIAPGRPNVVARRGRGRLLFCTHLDTVPPFLPAQRQPDRVSGRGACDAKGILACMLAATAQLIAAGHDDLAFLLVVGEEVDHAGAKVARGYGLEADAVILGEPTGCVLMRAQKGILRITLSASGRAAHSGYPERGESAIDALLQALSRLRALPLGADPLLGPGLMNIGVIHGGVAANVLAPHAEAEILLRTVSPGEALRRRIEELIGPDITVRLGALTDPVHLAIVDGYPTAVAGFGSDAPYLTGIGPVVLAGPGSILDAHTADEHITFAQLARGVELYTSLAQRLLTGTPLRRFGER